MRSARIVAPRRVEFITVAVPEPEAGQVRVKLQGCGVCGSNTAVWQGRPWFEYPLAPGIPVMKAGALSMHWVRSEKLSGSATVSPFSPTAASPNTPPLTPQAWLRRTEAGADLPGRSARLRG
jgi:hypothetical protein